MMLMPQKKTLNKEDIELAALVYLPNPISRNIPKGQLSGCTSVRNELCRLVMPCNTTPFGTPRTEHTLELI